MRSFLFMIGTAALLLGGADASCCKVCSNSQPCGDGCIAHGLHCSKTHGCACGTNCCKQCGAGKACGDGCIARGLQCSKPHGCACGNGHSEF
jgi:hypothetical protein